MVYPTDPSHPLYVKPGEDFRAHMVEYIRKHFASTLGTAVGLLDLPGGLDQVQEVVAKRLRAANDTFPVRKAA